MKTRLEERKPLNLNDQLNAISKELLPEPRMLFPTPRANSGKDSCVHGDGGLDLQTAVKMWPTPRAGNPGSRPNCKGGKILAEEARKSVFPTPTASDATVGNIIGEDDLFYLTDNGVPRKINKSGTDGSLGLARFAKMFPTPLATDGDKNSRFDKSHLPSAVFETARLIENAETPEGQLNADWVDVLMGYPQGWTNVSKNKLRFLNFPFAWLDDSWENGIPRIITGQKNRVKRLKGAGNSVVPLIPALIFSLLKDGVLNIFFDANNLNGEVNHDLGRVEL